MNNNISEMRIYQNRDNVETQYIAKRGAAIELDPITRAVLTVGGQTFDSDLLPAGSIWWDDTEVVRGKTMDVIKFKLGTTTEGLALSAGRYEDGVLVLYDLAHPNGYQVATDIQVTVVA